MQNKQVVCKPTSWFKTRVIGMGLFLLGFGLYFFYDAQVGYPEKNELFFTHKAFEQAGTMITEVASAEEWQQKAAESTIDFQNYPIPQDVDRSNTPWPPELADYELVKKGWNDAWLEYTKRTQLPIKAEDQPLDQGKITEQWVAGSICCLLVLGCLYLFLRTMKRVMSIDGTKVTAAGTEFDVADIKLLDLRKWRHKGIAYAQLDNKKVRLDGFCYGGFDKNDPTKNAEEFIAALKEAYKGDVMDYAEAEDAEPSASEADSPGETPPVDKE